MVYTFDGYSLDPTTRELRRNGEVVAIEPQVFDVLECLVRNHERIVSREVLIAEVWGGRIVSDSAVSSRISAARRAIGDASKSARLIKTISRRGFRFVGAVVEPEQTDRLNVIAPPSFAPAIVVLPFVSLLGKRAEDELVRGIVEDLTTALAQVPWLSVTSRSQSSNYQGWAVDVRQVGRELLVNYLIEGSVRRSSGIVRVTCRLIDATDGTQIWAHHFDIKGTALGLQDEVVSNIVCVVSSLLEQSEIRRVKGCPPDSLNFAQRYLRGLGNLYQWDRDGIETALRVFREAIAVEPEFGPAYGMAAYCYVQRQSYGWIIDRAKENAECERYALTAAELGKRDGFTLSKAAHAISSVVGDLDSGAILIERALDMNPRMIGPWYVSGWINLFLGRVELATEHLMTAIEINSSDPLIFKIRAALAYAHLLDGHYDEGSKQALRALAVRPGYLTAIRGAAAGLALAGRRDDARQLIRIMQEQDPSVRLSNLSGLLPFQRKRDIALWTDGLQRAGLPD